MLTSISNKPYVKTSKNYYTLSRNNHFLSSPIRSYEMDVYNKSLPKQFYYPQTMLYTFEKDYMVDNFYMELRKIGVQHFPRLETDQVKLTKGKIWIDIILNFSEKNIEEFYITKTNLDETLFLAKKLKTNIYIIHKYYCDSSKIKLQGTFLPILQQYIDCDSTHLGSNQGHTDNYS